MAAPASDPVDDCPLDSRTADRFDEIGFSLEAERFVTELLGLLRDCCKDIGKKGEIQQDEPRDFEQIRTSRNGIRPVEPCP